MNMDDKMSSEKCRPFCLGSNAFICNRSVRHKQRKLQQMMRRSHVPPAYRYRANHTYTHIKTYTSTFGRKRTCQKRSEQWVGVLPTISCLVCWMATIRLVCDMLIYQCSHGHVIILVADGLALFHHQDICNLHDNANCQFLCFWVPLCN